MVSQPNHDLVKFRIPASFIAGWATLTPGELAYGYIHGWLSAEEAVRTALDGLRVLPNVPNQYEELALLLSTDLDRVPDLIESLSTEINASSAKVWLFLALAWIYEHRDNYPDPLEVVESLYADFDYPADIEDFVRFMPAKPGVPLGIPALYDRWREYLHHTANELADRQT